MSPFLWPGTTFDFFQLWKVPVHKQILKIIERGFTIDESLILIILQTCNHKAMYSWSSVHSYFLCKNLNTLCTDYLIIFQDLLIFLILFLKADFKRSLNTRKLFKSNIIKWKTKQSWKGNVWKYLFMLPIFFTWGRE